MAARSRCTVVSLTEWGSTFATTMTVSSRPSGVNRPSRCFEYTSTESSSLAWKRMLRSWPSAGCALRMRVQDAEVERQRAPLVLGGGEVARPVLVLLVVDRLLGAGARHRLEELEARSRRPRSAPRSPRSSRRTVKAAGPPNCRYSVRMSGVFTNRFGRMKSAVSWETEVRNSSSSCLRVAPGEVRVRLLEADHRERLHHRGAGERLGEEDDVGVVARSPRRSAAPRTSSGFVCGLSTRKIRTPCFIQCRTMPQHLRRRCPRGRRRS